LYPKWKKIAYSTGSFAASLSYNAFNAFLFYFYVQICALPVHLYSIGFAIYGLWNAINDPLFGFLSDKLKTKRGRRIPLVIYGNIPLMLAFMFTWAPKVEHINAKLISFEILGVPIHVFGLPYDLFLYFTIIGILFDTFYTAVILAWTALFPEMFESLEERAEVQQYRSWIGIVGTIFGLGLAPMFVDAFGWFGMGIILGLLTAISLFISLLGSEEKGYYLVEEPMPVLEALRYTFRNKVFVIFVFTNLMLQYSVLLMEQLLPVYVQFVLGEEQTVTGILYLVILLTMIPSIIIWNKIAVSRGPYVSAFYGLLIFGFTLLPLLFIQTLSEAIIVAILIGFVVASPMYVFDILIAEAIDYDEYVTGKRREGAYFGTNALIIRLATLLVSATLLLLKPFGYVEGAPVQTESAIFGIRLLISVFTFIGALLAAYIISRYPLKGAIREEVKRKLEELHKEKLSKRPEVEQENLLG